MGEALSGFGLARQPALTVAAWAAMACNGVAEARV